MDSKFYRAFVEEIEKAASPKRDLAVGAAMAAGGGLLLMKPSTVNDLIGLKRVYHGTDPKNVPSIQAKGLKAERGGTGSASVHYEEVASKIEGRKDYRERSKGLVHVTPMKNVARGYAAFHVAPFGTSGKRRNQAMVAGMATPVYGKEGLIEADIPKKLYDKFEKDTDSTIMAIPTPALKGAVDVPAKYIKGGEGYSRTKMITERLKDVPTVAVEDPKSFAKGMVSAAGGVLLAGLGAALGIKGLKKVKVAKILNLNKDIELARFERLVNRDDVYGHRTHNPDAVLSTGKLISATEALRKSKLKSFEAGRGVGTHKGVDFKDRLTDEQLDTFQSALLRPDPDQDKATDVVVEAKVKYHDAMKEFLRKRHGDIKRFLKSDAVKDPEKFRERNLSVPKLSPNIFVTKGGILNAPQYGDVALLVRSRVAKPSPYANLITNEYVVDPIRPMEPRSVGVKSGVVIASGRKIEELNKKYPGYDYIAEEDIPSRIKSKITLPTRSVEEITQRLLPAIRSGTIKLSPR